MDKTTKKNFIKNCQSHKNCLLWMKTNLKNENNCLQLPKDLPLVTLSDSKNAEKNTIKSNH